MEAKHLHSKLASVPLFAISFFRTSKKDAAAIGATNQDLNSKNTNEFDVNNLKFIIQNSK